MLLCTCSVIITLSCTRSKYVSIPYLANALAKSESDTLGPQIGRRPLQRVLAFCSVALSHSSRLRANLEIDKYVKKMIVTSWS